MPPLPTHVTAEQIQSRAHQSFWSLSHGGTLDLNGLLNGAPVFLIGGGPSLQTCDLEALRAPGILTFGMNNSPFSVRPNFWVSVDQPSHFLKSIWFDPTITKFVRVQHRESLIFDNEARSLMSCTVSECPNVILYESELNFSPETFLSSPVVNWGTSENNGGRSVMLAAFKLLYHLGAGHVFLLGVDFHMTECYTYHFPQARSPDSVRGNMKSYRILEERFKALRPEFEANHFYLWNCNPESQLEAFPHMPFDTALRFAARGFPKPGERESTEGLYDRTESTNSSADVFPTTSLPRDRSGIRRIDRSKHPEVVHAAELLAPRSVPESAGVLLLGDRRMEWILPWWFHYFEMSNPDIPVALVDAGLSRQARDFLATKKTKVIPLESSLPEEVPTWFHKPFAIACSPFSSTVFCDLDCEVRGDISPLFHWAEAGITLGKDLFPASKFRKFFRERYYYNSGLIGLRSDASILERWCEESLELHRKFRSDQEILNLTIYEAEAVVVEMPEHFHQLRLEGDHREAVVMHWTGDPGKHYIRKSIESMDLTFLA